MNLKLLKFNIKVSYPWPPETKQETKKSCFIFDIFHYVFGFAFCPFENYHKILVFFEIVQNFKISDLALAKVEKVNIADIYVTTWDKTRNSKRGFKFRQPFYLHQSSKLNWLWGRFDKTFVISQFLMVSALHFLPEQSWGFKP